VRARRILEDPLKAGLAAKRKNYFGSCGFTGSTIEAWLLMEWPDNRLACDDMMRADTPVAGAACRLAFTVER
jgi:hypothetical protein